MVYFRLVLIYLAVILLGGYVVSALAAPEDDYQEGLRAYRTGDMVRAMSTLRKGADAGHAPAQALLGVVLEKADYPQEAAEYYRKAADQGNADGRFGLGMMYITGNGMKQDPGQARPLIVMAADQGHTQAINMLAESAIKGKAGLFRQEIDPKEALAWIRRAADGNYIPALEYLGRAYRQGLLGLAVDVKQAQAFENRVKKLRAAAGSKPTTAQR